MKDDYEIIEELGKGAFGYVVLARHTQPPPDTRENEEERRSVKDYS